MPTNNPLEKDIEAFTVRWAKARGILTYKFSSPSQRGVPDRVFVHQGKVLFLEFKRRGQRPTRLQEHHIGLLQHQGVAATWADSVEAAKTVLRRVFHLEDTT